MILLVAQCTLAIKNGTSSLDGMYIKSSMLHSIKTGGTVFDCKRALSNKYSKMPRVIKFKYPHCLGCFKKDDLRIRDVDQLANALADSAKKRTRQTVDSALKLRRKS